MRATAWIVAAFAAGMIASTAATRVRADTAPFPSWIAVGSCLTIPDVGTEIVLDIQGSWVRTSRGERQPPEVWRNLARISWVKRVPENTCRHMRR